MIVTCRCFEDQGITNQLTIINYVALCIERSYLIPDAEKDCLKTLGCNHKDYGLHILRSGGATATVQNNQHLPERSLKRHGRWKSNSAKDMYILEDISKRL